METDKLQKKLRDIFGDRFSISDAVKSNYARGEDIFDPILPIAVVFPNNNAEPFYRHILKFDSIEQSYFSVDLDELNITADWPESGGEKVNIPIEYLRKRFDEHPQYNYQDFTLEDSTFIYKIYRGQVDILYYSQLKKDFQYFLEHLKNEGYRKVNIISQFGSFLKNIGFKYQSYNAKF